MLKTILQILKYGIPLVLIFLTVLWASQLEEKTVLSNVSVHVNTDHGNFFVDKERLTNSLLNRSLQIGVDSLSDIDVYALEKWIESRPEVKNAEVFTTKSGILKVEVEQRKPLIRIFNDLGESYYIDVEGRLMPLSQEYTSRVMIVNGNVRAPYNLSYQFNVSSYEGNNDDLSQLKDLFSIAKFIEGNEFWAAQIEQIFVKSNNEIELIPRVGLHKILIGDATNLNEKLTNLMVFYKEAMPKTGWNEYKELNLKYRNQIVCTKR